MINEKFFFGNQTDSNQSDMKNEGNFPTEDVKEEEKHEATEVVVAVESQPDFVLDEHFKSMLKPINLMQSLFFSTRCIIKNNIILPKSIFSVLYSLFGTVAFCFVYIYPVTSNGDDFSENYSFLVRYEMYFDVLFYCFGFLLNFMTLVKHKHTYVQLILKINKISRVMKNKKFIEKARKSNWMLILPFVITLGFVGYWAIAVKVNVWSIIGMVSLICFDINIYHASKIINLLKKQLLLWVTEIEDFSNVTEENLAYDDRKISILKIYFDVIAAFDLLKQTFQVMVSKWFF